jgi:hypothetical protein
MERDPVSEMLCFLEYQTMAKVQKPSNSEYLGLIKGVVILMQSRRY